MVAFKRKPVQRAPLPEVDDEDQVYQYSPTGEVFATYEEYLSRLDFYKQRVFTCQITGHSGLTYEEALKSEVANAQDVEQSFPEPLKGPVLRRVQFQTISRIDTLVDLVYDEFKTDYYPGEAVTVLVVTPENLAGEKLTGVVRDKSSFGPKQLPDGTMGAAFSRYFVLLDNRPADEAVVDDTHIWRDRKVFTKQVLRAFIKKTVSREAWNGAPWLVDNEIAQFYHIDIRVPPHLRQESKAAERKQKQAAQKNAALDYEGMVGSFQGNGSAKLPELKPAPKSHKSKQQQGQQLAKSKQQSVLNPAPQIPFQSYPPPQFYQPPQYLSHTFQATGPPLPVGPHPPGPHFAHFQHQNFGHFHPMQSMPHHPPPPPAIKYPIEDLQVAPRENGPKRPKLKFLTRETQQGVVPLKVGLFLESWNTLNVFCEVYFLDSFTWDDFLEAMEFTSEDRECELFTEIHCAALKGLVASEADGGKILARLPETEEETDDDESAGEPTPEPEPVPEPEPRMRTRRSMKNAEAEALKVEPVPAKSPTPVTQVHHRAAEMQVEIGWIDRLRKRDFKNGGWQVIVVGLLLQLSKDPKKFETCEILLKQLAPLDMEPTAETARTQYFKLSLNDRGQALESICILLAETKAVRKYIEECAEQQTSFRKERIVFQRTRKTLLEELRLLNEERKIQLPDNMPPSPTPANANVLADVSMTGVDDEAGDSNDDTIDTVEGPHQGRSLRRGHDRAAERKRQREVEQAKRDKLEAESKLPKQTKTFIKLEKDMQKKRDAIQDAEDEIAIIEGDLREAACLRTAYLGKDRFWNRYYWYERNGMPFAGMPNSSTVDSGYANGCLWVQGPDDIEREGFIDMKDEWQKEYVERFKMTVPQRKKMEEGETSVMNAWEFGYFEDEESIDALIQYLDSRGTNEHKLLKELKTWAPFIKEHMKARKEYIKPIDEKAKEKETLDVVAAASGKRMGTRRKEQVVEVAAMRCLNWRNTTALRELKYLHGDEPRTRKGTKKMAPPPPPVEVEERQTRSEAKGKRKRGE